MIIRALAVATLAVIVASSEASAVCLMSYCKAEAPSRAYITNKHHQRLGDLYQPTPGARVQIRNVSRQIIGYIEPTGRVTNTRRQEVLSIEGLTD